MTTYYIAPQGDDGNPGTTAAAPKKTFASALQLVGPGSALMLEDGTYETAVNGSLQAKCPTNVSGTTDAPVIVAAVDEGLAKLHSDGSQSAISITGCDHWILDGLTATIDNLSFDAGTSPPHTVAVYGGHEVELRRLLVDGNNQALATEAVYLLNVTNARVVESEIYDFDNIGLELQGATAEVQRVYVNARGGGVPAGSVGVGCNGPTCLLENVVVEGTDIAFQFNVFPTGPFSILGSIALGARTGILAKVGSPFVVRDFAALNSAPNANAGLWVGYGAFATIDNVTLYYTGGASLVSSGDGSTAADLDSIHSSGPGISIQPADWSVEYSNSWPSGYSPALDAGPYRQCLNVDPSKGVDPSLGECLVYVPPGSVLFDAGKDGGPIGANIIYRYEDAGLTGRPLWACESFPCGPLAPGINDQDAGTCRNLTTRLNFVDGGCPFPATDP